MHSFFVQCQYAHREEVWVSQNLLSWLPNRIPFESVEQLTAVATKKNSHDLWSQQQKWEKKGQREPLRGNATQRVIDWWLMQKNVGRSMRTCLGCMQHAAIMFGADWISSATAAHYRTLSKKYINFLYVCCCFKSLQFRMIVLPDAIVAGVPFFPALKCFMDCLTSPRGKALPYLIFPSVKHFTRQTAWAKIG